MRSCRPRNGLPCEGSTSVFSGSSMNLSIDSRNRRSGSDSGSMSYTLTLVEMRGDMMLPRISTNVSVYDIEPESDPLRLFLESIDKFIELPENTLVLPSHGKPFRGLHERIQQLHDHHDERLAEVVEACEAAPQSAADMLPVLFKRQLDLHQTTFAMGESVA